MIEITIGNHGGVRQSLKKIFMLAEVLRALLTSTKKQSTILISKCTFVRVGGAYGDGYQAEVAPVGLSSGIDLTAFVGRFLR
jgi:hypothetical protein